MTEETFTGNRWIYHKSIYGVSTVWTKDGAFASITNYLGEDILNCI